MKKGKQFALFALIIYCIVIVCSDEVGQQVANPNAPIDYNEEKAMQDSHICTDVSHTYCDGGDSTGRYICECDGLGCKYLTK